MIDGFSSTDQEINNIGIYWSAAKSFGFTPEEVDKMESIILQGMLLLEKKRNEKENREMEKMSRR